MHGKGLSARKGRVLAPIAREGIKGLSARKGRVSAREGRVYQLEKGGSIREGLSAREGRIYKGGSIS